jgi:predicted ester cyclase
MRAQIRLRRLTLWTFARRDGAREPRHPIGELTATMHLAWGLRDVIRWPRAPKSTQAREESMNSMTAVAKQFFEACEAGKGWEVCKAFCKPYATFSAQAEPLAEVKSLQQYTDWMQGLMKILPDGRYELKSFATDEDQKNVSAYGVFLGTHTGQGGPCPPTGKKVKTDYVYVMDFDGDKIRHMTKIWHSGLAMKELGWA